MAFCTKCGAEVSGSFCAACGNPMGGGAAPGATAAPAKKKSIVPIILIGCGGVLVLAILGTVLTGYFVAKKVADAGLDPDLMAKNPGVAITKLLATLNPDVDVVSVNEDKGVVIVRDKKSGKTITLDFEELKQGKMKIEGEGGEKVEIGGGDASSAKLPSWLPAYPKIKQTLFNVSANEGGSVTFSTDDAIDDVASFYEAAFNKASLKVNKASAEATGQGRIVTVTGEGEGRQANVAVTRAEGVTNVILSYANK